jgi:hypothetical protein
MCPDAAPASSRLAEALHSLLRSGQGMRSLPSPVAFLHRRLGWFRSTPRLACRLARHRCPFLEIERFDRHGAHGRSALCSWAAVNNAWFGLSGRPWSEGAARLLERGLIANETRDAITRLWHFGQLIGNTDMHDSNLSFVPGEPGLRLAPVYDMLPML